MPKNTRKQQATTQQPTIGKKAVDVINLAPKSSTQGETQQSTSTLLENMLVVLSKIDTIIARTLTIIAWPVPKKFDSEVSDSALYTRG